VNVLVIPSWWPHRCYPWEGSFLAEQAAAIAAVADATASTFELKSTADFINRLRDRFSMLDPASIRELFSKMSNRYLRQFPNLRELATEGLHRFLAEDFMERESDSVVAKVLRVLRDPPMEESGMDGDYLEAVRDILANDKVKSMASIPHHDASILQHSLTVSQAAFFVAERYGLDARSVARGALLHDFFLYDWRKARVKHHATGHAKTALKNARACFSLNEIEAQLAAARRTYNAAVTDFNNAVQMFPSSVVASMSGFATRSLLETSEEDRQRPDVKALFNG